MTVNLTGEFFKDFSQKQDGRFPAGEYALYCLQWPLHYSTTITGPAEAYPRVDSKPPAIPTT